MQRSIVREMLPLTVVLRCDAAPWRELHLWKVNVAGGADSGRLPHHRPFAERVFLLKQEKQMWLLCGPVKCP